MAFVYVKIILKLEIFNIEKYVLKLIIFTPVSRQTSVMMKLVNLLAYLGLVD